MNAFSQSYRLRLPPSGGRPSRLRWAMISMAFLATVLNYLHRLSFTYLSAGGPLRKMIPDEAFGYIGTAFFIAYMISNAFSGYAIDKLGTRLGYSLCMACWTTAALLHAFASTAFQFGFFRFLLGLGEAGNWPAAIKLTNEWFSAEERSTATGIFNSGAAIGAVIAPPLITWLGIAYGWQAGFIVIGLLGYAWLTIFWFLYYTPPKSRPASGPSASSATNPSAHSSSTPAPAAAPNSSTNTAPTPAQAPTSSSTTAPITEPITTSPAPSPSLIPPLKLLRTRFVSWLFVSKFFTDSIWYFITFWIGRYLVEVHHWELSKIGWFALIPFIMADVGNLLGGLLTQLMIRRGIPVSKARKITAAVSGLIMAFSLLLAPLLITGPAMALGILAAAAFGYAAYTSNTMAFPADVVPAHATASVWGIVSVGAGLGGAFFQSLSGIAVKTISEKAGYASAYNTVFAAYGFIALAGLAIVLFLMGPLVPDPRLHPDPIPMPDQPVSPFPPAAKNQSQ